ncbi:MAG: RidA family protein [Granulosicoccaceae bacterium]
MNLSKAGNSRRCADHVVHNGVGYFVEVPPDASADFETQVLATLKSLDEEMAAAGTDRTKLLLVHIYLTDIANIDRFNLHWDTWLDGAKPPVRACVEPAKLADPLYAVELVATVAIPNT